MATKKRVVKKQVTQKPVATPAQAIRFNEGKPMLSFMLDFPAAMSAFAHVCEAGAEKYERHNWKKGLPITEIEDSLLRHSMAFHNCEDVDSETKCFHAAHMMWNSMALIECLTRHGDKFDNRDFANEGDKA